MVLVPTPGPPGHDQTRISETPAGSLCVGFGKGQPMCFLIRRKGLVRIDPGLMAGRFANDQLSAMGALRSNTDQQEVGRTFHQPDQLHHRASSSSRSKRSDQLLRHLERILSQSTSSSVGKPHGPLSIASVSAYILLEPVDHRRLFDAESFNRNGVGGLETDAVDNVHAQAGTVLGHDLDGVKPQRLEDSAPLALSGTVATTEREVSTTSRTAFVGPRLRECCSAAARRLSTQPIRCGLDDFEHSPAKGADEFRDMPMIIPDEAFPCRWPKSATCARPTAPRTARPWGTVVHRFAGGRGRLRQRKCGRYQPQSRRHDARALWRAERKSHSRCCGRSPTRPWPTPPGGSGNDRLWTMRIIQVAVRPINGCRLQHALCGAPFGDLSAGLAQGSDRCSASTEHPAVRRTSPSTMNQPTVSVVAGTRSAAAACSRS